MSDVAKKADAASRPVAQVGMGQVGNAGHPLHPATGASHPYGAWTSSINAG